MAWKLKKSKGAGDEQPVSTPETASADTTGHVSQFDRASEPDTLSGPSIGGTERSAVVLDDSDYRPELLTGARVNGANGLDDVTDLFPVASDEDLERYLRGDSAFGSSSSDHGVAEHDDSTDGNGQRPSIDLDNALQIGGPIELDDVNGNGHNGAGYIGGSHPIELDDPIDSQGVGMAGSSSGPATIEPDYISSALNASDEAVASFRDAGRESPSAIPAAASQSSNPDVPAAMENWDLDAFAPYKPPSGGSVARSSIEIPPDHGSESAPIEESLVGSVTASRLIVRLGQFSASYELLKAETTVGRPDPRTSVFPDVAVEWDDAVSRAHCRVLHKQDGDYVEDTGSTNGTRLNDKNIAPYTPIRLTDGDRIGVGEKTEISYIK